MEALLIIAVFAVAVWGINRAITASGVRPRIMGARELNLVFDDRSHLRRDPFNLGDETYD